MTSSCNNDWSLSGMIPTTKFDTETRRSSGWLPWPLLGTPRLAINISCNDQGSHPGDLSIFSGHDFHWCRIGYQLFWIRFLGSDGIRLKWQTASCVISRNLELIINTDTLLTPHETISMCMGLSRSPDQSEFPQVTLTCSRLDQPFTPQQQPCQKLIWFNLL